MIGPLVNAAVIFVCAVVGRFLIRGIPPRFEDTLKKTLGLAVIYIGIKGAMDNQRVLLLIISLVSGAAIGEIIDIDGLMNRLGVWVERKLYSGKVSGGNFSKGFVSASILFCTGAMAITGSIQSGLTGSHDILFAKSVLDGTFSLIFGASMGIGVAFSALPVLIYQGGIALLAQAASGFLSGEVVREMSAAGSLVVSAIGFNFLAANEIKVANLIPAIFIPGVVIGLFG
jgi:uncharacterized membrane protein YqgA involved in biofilm formation